MMREEDHWQVELGEFEAGRQSKLKAKSWALSVIALGYYLIKCKILVAGARWGLSPPLYIVQMDCSELLWKLHYVIRLPDVHLSVLLFLQPPHRHKVAAALPAIR